MRIHLWSELSIDPYLYITSLFYLHQPGMHNNTCTYIYAYTYTFTYTRNIYMYVHTYVHVYSHLYTHAHIHTYIYTYLYICVYTDMYVYILILFFTCIKQAVRDKEYQYRAYNSNSLPSLYKSMDTYLSIDMVCLLLAGLIKL